MTDRPARNAVYSELMWPEWNATTEAHGVGSAEDANALLDALDAEAAFAALPAWEAMYEPGNVSDYLIGYANSEAAAKGAAIAWLQSESDINVTTIEWVTQPHGDQHDQWFELIQNHDDGIHTGTGINVRHRTADPS
ncbi:hypothetical protein J7I98_04305 [Streptomyces sp. ISL-98]|uniref:hypothetical protein n=1 Tax=Streptomyces sp. ISL-98 TaxID=2819192 RepID=UPI001BE8AB52|nr:hypothetical protein [Streptomyces sp. ISL-98]MBT2505130.1 hypothetical protein [Streptomyces sp. ISL-98]